MLLSIQSHLPVCHPRWDEHGFRLAYQYSREEHETVSGQLFAALERLRVIWGSGRAHYADLAAEPEHVVVERGDLARLREQMAAATADLEEQLKIEKEALGRAIIALRFEKDARVRAVVQRNEALAERDRLRKEKAELESLMDWWRAATSDAVLEDCTAGEAVTAGQVVYLKTSDQKYWLAQADDVDNDTVRGIALHDAAANQSLTIQRESEG